MISGWPASTSLISTTVVLGIRMWSIEYFVVLFLYCTYQRLEYMKRVPRIPELQICQRQILYADKEPTTVRVRTNALAHAHTVKKLYVQLSYVLNARRSAHAGLYALFNQISCTCRSRSASLSIAAGTCIWMTRYAWHSGSEMNA